PPTQHALDFLDAPDKLLAFLDKQVVKWFLPGVAGSWSVFQSMNRSVRFVLDKIEDATGVGVLSQISEFFSGMGELFDGFEARVERVTRLLRAPETAFVLVAGPDEQVLGQAEYLQARMEEKGMPLKGVVMNRVHRLPGGDAGGDHDPASLPAALGALAAAAALPDEVERSELVDNLRALREGWRARARGDALRIELFCGSLPETVPVVLVPNLSRDVHDLDGLRSLHEHLFAAVPELF
ncbi:MAG: hypothetical protein VCC00_00775, partial [Deltaproteobacteria bacterium]